MAEAEKQVRVFISSTFRDMHAERDHLVTVVFPELRERLDRLGLEFYDVDLRWGVPALGVDGERANSWEYCKQWIHRVEPFFICMLGQRYGWTPPAHEIVPADRRSYAGMSITEMEIEHAVLKGQLRRRSFFYLRETPVPEDAQAQVYGEFVDPDGDGRLADLKRRIEGSSRPRRPYTPRWTGEGFDQLDAFGAMVLEDLWSGVLRDERYLSKDVWRVVLGGAPEEDLTYTDEERAVPEDVWERLVEEAKPPPPDPLEAEAEQMAAFAASRLAWFRGREDELAELRRFVDDDLAEDASRVLAVRAVPGQGKSALLAAFAARLADTSHLVIAHYVGATERSADLRWLLDRLVRELDRNGVSAPGGEEAGQDVESLRRRLGEQLEDYAGERRVVLVIDAVNQLAGGHDLTWMPQRMGPGVRLVVSCIDDPSEPSDSPERRVLAALAARRPEPRAVDLPPLDEDDVRLIVVDYLEEYCKVLDPPHIEAIAQMEQAKNPLYLLVMLNELRTLGGNEMHKIVPTLIRELPIARSDTVRLFDWVLDRLEVFGREPVRLWSTYLFLGRVGMSSRELSELLHDALGEEASRTALRIERGIRRYLQHRGDQLDFFHGQLATAVAARYLGDDHRPRHEAHLALARYFRRKADPEEERTWDAYPRGLSELPYHQTEGAGEDDAAWQDVFDTLTDFRFLERKAADVGAVEQTDADGGTTTVYTGVFQLQDDFELALAKLGGDGDGGGGRRPLIVTAVDFRDGNGVVVRCPWCNTSSPFREEWRGDTIPCPNCRGPLKVNPFLVGEAAGSRSE